MEEKRKLFQNSKIHGGCLYLSFSIQILVLFHPFISNNKGCSSCKDGTSWTPRGWSTEKAKKLVVPLFNFGRAFQHKSTIRKRMFKVTNFNFWSNLPTVNIVLNILYLIKFIKSKYQSELTDEHLVELVWTASLTSYQPDFKKLKAKMNTRKSTSQK